MMRMIPIALVAIWTATPALAQPSIDQIIKKVDAKFEPAEARPGQTVTLSIAVQLIDGWHTYPTVQPDKGAKAQTNRVTFPEGGPIVFVGPLEDPPGAKEKSEPLAMIESLLYYPGGATWERKAVVLPTTPAGSAAAKIKFRLLVCDKDNCLPPKTLDLDVPLKIAGAPVAVDPKYKDEVEKKK